MIVWRCTITETGTWGEVTFDPDKHEAVLTSDDGSRIVVKGDKAIKLLATFTAATRLIRQCVVAQEAS